MLTDDVKIHFRRIIHNPRGHFACVKSAILYETISDFQVRFDDERAYCFLYLYSATTCLLNEYIEISKKKNENPYCITCHVD